MFVIRQTPEFRDWAAALRDDRAKAHIAARIERMERGLLGDVKPVGGPVAEVRVDYGPGYRLYFCQRGPVLIVLLCGGTKRGQQRDIARAQALAADWEN